MSLRNPPRSGDTAPALPCQTTKVPTAAGCISTSASYRDLKTLLVGRFDLTRDIVMPEEPPYHFTGEATISVDSDTELRYEERGLLTTPEQSFEVTRAYRYTLVGPTSATVRFSDGSYFHDLDLAKGRCRAIHYCGEDIYNGLFVVDGDDLVVRWSCRGPNKHYVATSKLIRPNSPLRTAP